MLQGGAVGTTVCARGIAPQIGARAATSTSPPISTCRGRTAASRSTAGSSRSPI
jgi:hypothetical protein